MTVTPDGGDPVEFGKGDLVTFPEGMSCTWEIHGGCAEALQVWVNGGDRTAQLFDHHYVRPEGPRT